MGRLIRAFLIGAALGFLVGLVAPPREKRSTEKTSERWDVAALEEGKEELVTQASEK